MKKIRVEKQNMYMLQCGSLCACDMGMSQKVIEEVNNTNKDKGNKLYAITSILIKKKKPTSN